MSKVYTIENGDVFVRDEEQINKIQTFPYNLVSYKALKVLYKNVPEFEETDESETNADFKSDFKAEICDKIKTHKYSEYFIENGDNFNIVIDGEVVDTIEVRNNCLIMSNWTFIKHEDFENFLEYRLKEHFCFKKRILKIYQDNFKEIALDHYRAYDAIGYESFEIRFDDKGFNIWNVHYDLKFKWSKFKTFEEFKDFIRHRITIENIELVHYETHFTGILSRMFKASFVYDFGAENTHNYIFDNYRVQIKLSKSSFDFIVYEEYENYPIKSFKHFYELLEFLHKNL